MFHFISNDPLHVQTTVDEQLMALLHGTLYEYEYLKNPLTLKPYLLADHPLVKDEKNVHLKIQSGLVYANGEKLTSKDFIYAWKRLADPRLPSYGYELFGKYIKGLASFRQEFQSLIEKKANASDLNEHMKKNISGLKYLNDEEFIVDFTVPFHAIKHALANVHTAPIHESLTFSPSGPYEIFEHHPGKKIILKRNSKYKPDFYPMETNIPVLEKNLFFAGKKLPGFDTIEFHIIPDSETLISQFNQKKIDRISLEPEDKKKIDEKNIVILEKQILNVLCFNKNLQKEVRLFVDSIFSSTLKSIDSLHAFHLVDKKKISPPKKSFHLDLLGTNLASRNLGEKLIEAFELQKVILEITYNSYSRFQEKISKKNYELILYPFFILRNEMQIFELIVDQNQNYFDAYMNFLKHETPESKKNLETILKTELPLIPLFYSPYILAFQPWIQGHRGTVSIPQELKFYFLDPIKMSQMIGL